MDELDIEDLLIVTKHKFNKASEDLKKLITDESLSMDEKFDKMVVILHKLQGIGE